jgi:hypothetical protein
MIRTSLVAAALLSGSLAAMPAMAKTTSSNGSEADQTRQLNLLQLQQGGSGEALPLATTQADYVHHRLQKKLGTASAAGANSRDDGIGAAHTQSK